MNIEQIQAAMTAIIDAAEGRQLTDEEVTQYEDLEGQLQAARRDTQIRARQAAYQTVAPGQLAAVAHVGEPVDDWADYNRAFENYLRTGKPNSDLMQPTNAQSAGTDSEGGYTVSPQFRQKLVEVRKAYGGLASVVDTFSTSTGATLEYPSLDDTSNEGSITSEGSAVASGADLDFGTVSLGAFKYTSAGSGSNLPLRVSVELLQDSEFDIERLVARALGTRVQRKQARDWVVGTGTTLPFGIADDASITADDSLATADTVTYQDLLNLETPLDPEYEQGALWVMNKKSWNRVRAIVDTAGRPIVMPQASSGAGTAPARELLGYPVLIDQGMPDLGSAGNIWTALGDWMEAYVIRRVAPFTLVVDPYSRAVNGQVQYHGWERADGKVQNRSAYVAQDDVA